jgi:hypothetical protein
MSTVERTAVVPGHNPFSTRYVRPGALAYEFAAGESATILVDRLAAHDWRGAIIGPHGSGKSTLLAALRLELTTRGVELLWFELHDGQRRLSSALCRERGHHAQHGRWRSGASDVPRFRCLDASAASPPHPGCLVVIDGYEQLSWVSRARLWWDCRQQGWGLLVTAHDPVRLPTLVATSASPGLAQQLVRRLLLGRSASITDTDVAAAYTRHAGNLRETLFGLYDLYEAQRAGR